jgi:nickel-dependent lactate racemase
VAIALADKTRPVPHAELLRPLLAELCALGVAPERTTLIIGTGAHPPMAPDEFARVVPADILSAYPVCCHDVDGRAGLVHLGETGRGTPVWANRRFVEADLRIVLGIVEPHQFMGFSGGAKGAAIGLAGRETIDRNHALMAEPGARLGCFDGNPARQDVEEIGRLAGIHCVLNAVLNDRLEIVTVLAGEPGAVMAAGIARVRALREVRVPVPFDLVIASAGGHPKDINLYQAQKALAHASLLARDGGTLILVAACPEGTGSPGYERWMAGMGSYEAVLERFQREGFRVGPHKAYLVARDAARVRVRLVSEMAPSLVRALLLTPAPSLDAAVAEALADLPPGGRVAVMPSAVATIPLVAGSDCSEEHKRARDAADCPP